MIVAFSSGENWFAYKASDVVQTLERAGAAVGYPRVIRVDNGPEFVSRDLDLWAYQRGVTWDFIRPGKPTDNAFAESFNGKVRAEWVSNYLFKSATNWARSKIRRRTLAGRTFGNICASSKPSVVLIKSVTARLAVALG